VLGDRRYPDLVAEHHIEKSREAILTTARANLAAERHLRDLLRNGGTP